MVKVTDLERARREQLGRGGYIDLVNSDFRAAGLVFPEEWYRQAWDLWRSDPVYRPSGRGGAAARETVAAFLREDSLATESSQVVLTSGSSVAYHMIFSLLAARRAGTAGHGTAGKSRRSAPTQYPPAGEQLPAIALPRPGYPLFEELVRGAGLQPAWYTLDPRRGFNINRDEIRALLEKKPLALVLISPDNPTGTVHQHSTLQTLLDICTETGTPLVSDEVFSAYRPTPDLPRPAGLLGGRRVSPDPPPVFTLNGLSKLCAAPETKLGWITVHGGAPGEEEELLESLDTMHDTYLTLSGYAEAAARAFLSRNAAPARTDLARQVAQRRERLESALRELPGVLLPGQEKTGGIHRVIQLEADLCAQLMGTVDDAEISRALLLKNRVYLHPGYLYGLDRKITGSLDPAFVVTCLHTQENLEEAICRLTRALRG